MTSPLNQMARLLVCSVLVYFFQIVIPVNSHAQLMGEYTQKVGKLSSLESKIQSGRDSVKVSLAAIQKTQDEKKQKEVFNEAVKLHEELKIAIREYNSLRDEIKYKFPKKHDQTIKRYIPIREESLDEIEKEMGLDGILSRVKTKIDKKYESFNSQEEESVSSSVSTLQEVQVKREEKGEEKSSPRLRLER